MFHSNLPEEGNRIDNSLNFDGRDRDAGGNRTHFSCFAGNRLTFWLQRQVSRQESNLILDLRRVVCSPAHPEDVSRSQRSEVRDQRSER